MTYINLKPQLILYMKKFLKASLGLAVGGVLVGLSSPAFSETETGGAGAETGAAAAAAGTGTSLQSTANALGAGMAAPIAKVGTDDIQSKKGTIQFSNSLGSSDAFSVGTTSSISASANASSTPDYAVSSTATFGIDDSTINQMIGTATNSNSSSTATNVDIDLVSRKIAETKTNTDFTEITTNQSSGRRWRWRNRLTKKTTEIDETTYNQEKEKYTEDLTKAEVETLTNTLSNSGTITGSFNRTSSTNDVTVTGIGANNSIAASDTLFDTKIIKAGIDLSGTASSPVQGSAEDSAGTANGGASGSVSTTASANASTSQFVSSFAQAY